MGTFPYPVLHVGRFRGRTALPTASYFGLLLRHLLHHGDHQDLRRKLHEVSVSSLVDSKTHENLHQVTSSFNVKAETS